MVLVEPLSPSLQSVVPKLSANPALAITKCSSSLDAASNARKLGTCLIVLHVAREEDAIRHFTMHQLLKQQIARKQVRILVTSALRDEYANKKIAVQLGAEILSEPVNEKSLLFKIDRMVKQLPRAAQAATHEETRKKEEEKTEFGGRTPVRWAPALTLESDFWTLAGRKPRRVVSKWVVNLAGPPPGVGRWQAIESEKEHAHPRASDEQNWQWMPQDPETDPFIKEEGAWVFYGTCPKFIDDLWVFVGKKPTLGFFHEGQSYGSKIASGENGEILMAKDSPAAAKAMPLILASIEKVVRQKKSKGEPETEQASTGETYKFEPEHFGKASGEWECVSSGSGNRRWYVYVPHEILAEEVTDVRALDRYWFYFGSIAPQKSDEGWVFHDREPQKHERFADLPKPIQAFLMEFFSKAQESAIQAASEEGPVRDSDGNVVLVESSGDPSLPDPRRISGSAESEQSHEAEISEQRDSDDFGADPEEFGSGRLGRRKGEKSDRRSRKSRGDRNADAEAEIEAEHLTETEELTETETETGTEKSGNVSSDSEAPEWESKVDAGDPLGGPPPEEVDGRFQPVIRETTNGVISFRYELEAFGTPGGDWGMASTGTRGRSLYVYLPLELNNQVVEDVKRLGIYWTYFGARPPKAITDGGKKYWAFQDRKPHSIERFGDCPKEAQKYLLELFAGEKKHASFEADPPGKGPAMIQTVEAPGPALSPLAIAFLMSELISKRDLDRKRVAPRFCQYLSASFGGLSVELWVNGGQSWFCGGSAEKNREAAVARFGKLFETPAPPVEGFLAGALGIEEGIYCVPITLAVGGSTRLLGALAVGGQGASRISREYARAVARTALGLLITLSGSAREDAAAA